MMAKPRPEQQGAGTKGGGPDGTTRVFDARPVIAAGQEPFEAIMAAVAELSPGEDLVVLAPFEPVPLEGVLSSQGFTFEATDIGGGDWSTRFSRPQ